MAILKETFGPEHIERAKELILSDWEKEAMYCPEISELHAEKNLEKMLSDLADRGLGISLLEEDRLVGYIALRPPRYGDNEEREFHAPLGGFHFEKEAYPFLNSILGDLRKQVASLNGTGISITTFLHETALVSSTFILDRIDAICTISSCTAQDTKPELVLQELETKEFPSVQNLKEKLTAFFAASPLYRHTTEKEKQVWLKDEKKRVFILKKQDEAKGFFALTKNGRNFLTENIWSSYGFFLEQENRGEGGGSALLQYTSAALTKEGERFLGTDYNILNAGAERFWKKRFTPYAGTYRWRFPS